MYLAVRIVKKQKHDQVKSLCFVHKYDMISFWLICIVFVKVTVSSHLRLNN